MENFGGSESVASILESSIAGTVEAWLERVEEDKELSRLPMTQEQRMGHIPKLLEDLVTRLRRVTPLGGKGLKSAAAEQHGRLRFEQGYTAGMLVEESRMFQVSVFETLHLNVKRLDLNTVMSDVMIIADEADSQLAQAMVSFTRANSAATA